MKNALRPNPDPSVALVKASNMLLSRATEHGCLAEEFGISKLADNDRPLVLTVTRFDAQELFPKLEYEDTEWKDYLAAVLTIMERAKGFRTILGIQKRIRAKHPDFGFHIFATTKGLQTELVRKQIQWTLTNQKPLKYDPHFLWELQIDEGGFLRTYDQMFLQILNIAPYENPHTPEPQALKHKQT